MTEPLNFVVHRTNGAEHPALYHGDDRIGCCDRIVFDQRIDTLPNGTELCAKPAGELLFELWSRWQALQSLGALPQRAGPPTPRTVA